MATLLCGRVLPLLIPHSLLLVSAARPGLPSAAGQMASLSFCLFPIMGVRDGGQISGDNRI